MTTSSASDLPRRIPPRPALPAAIEITAAPCTYSTGPGRRVAGTSYTATGPDGRQLSGSSLRQISRRLRELYPGHRVKVTDLRELTAEQMTEYRRTRAALDRP